MRPHERTFLIYRQERRAASAPPVGYGGARFELLDSPWKALTLARPLGAAHGPSGVLRFAAKVVSRSRLAYVVIDDGRIVHEGWMVIGRSPLYEVDPQDVVIGPIATVADRRDGGIATFALERAIDAMCARGHTVFFIHTDERNPASQRAISKAGFGEPATTLRRRVAEEPVSTASKGTRE